MRLLDRYLLRELLVPLGFCLSGFFIFWIAFDLFSNLEDLQKQHLSTAQVAFYYLLLSPSFLRIVLPIGLLLALLYALTRHARFNEITAMRAAGCSLWRVCLPYFSTGLIASLALFALSEFWAPQCSERAERLRESGSADSDSGSAQIVQNLGFVNARAGRTWQIGSYNLETGEMRQPQVHCKQGNGQWLSIFADRAIRTNGVWLFLHVREFLDAGSGARLLQPTLSTNALLMPNLTETPEQIRSEVRISARLSRLADTKEADVPLRVLVDYLRLHPRPQPEIAAWLRTMLYGRLAAPWTCLVVVIIAAPFAGATGRKNLFVGVASSIGICFGYFVLEKVSLALGTGGYLPPWLAAWLPNAVFASIGLYLFSRVR